MVVRGRATPARCGLRERAVKSTAPSTVAYCQHYSISNWSAPKNALPAASCEGAPGTVPRPSTNETHATQGACIHPNARLGSQEGGSAPPLCGRLTHLSESNSPPPKALTKLIQKVCSQHLSLGTPFRQFLLYLKRLVFNPKPETSF